jgi:DNA (cytosine-5)-methyltransferase 1
VRTALRIGSLFSGYGGLDMAVGEFFGAVPAWHCQWEPPDKKGRPDPHQFAAQVLAHRYPGVPNLGDITAVNWDQVEPVDILTGGFPCTDLSLAGARAGLNSETRSGLWLHMARAIEALRPRLVVIENVRGLLSAPADRGLGPDAPSVDDTTGGELSLRALGAVLGDLARLGFDAEWLGLPASAVGAPHERFRIFILAWPADPAGPRLEVGGIRRLAAGEGEAPVDAEGVGRRGGPRVDGVGAAFGRAAAADTDELGHHRPGARGAGRHEPANGGEPAADAEVGGLAELGGVPDGRDTVRGGQGRPDAPRRGQAPADAESVGRGEGWTEPARIVGGPDAPFGGAPDWGAYAAAVHRWEHVLGRPAPAAVDERGRLHPAFVEWMMGLPLGWLTAVPLPGDMTPSQARNAQLKAGGNGVVPQQAYAALVELWHRATAAVPARTAA